MPRDSTARIPCQRGASGITLAALLVLAWPAGAGSLRFLGTPSTTADRVEIRLDAPARPVDVGGDFTVEFFVRMLPGSNPVAATCDASNDRWIFGNIVLDRDVFGAGDGGDWGVALMQGRIAFGVSVGSTGATACGMTDLRSGDWHHVALTRSASSGQLRVFVDGQPEGQAVGAPGEASYRDGRSTQWPLSDPFLVLGNEKHFGPEAFAGWLDELRISRTIRYAGPFVPPSAPFVPDADTVALYGFNEGAGTTLGDRSGAVGGPSDGVLRVGGTPAAPQWSTDTPFVRSLFADGFEAP